MPWKPMELTARQLLGVIEAREPLGLFWAMETTNGSHVFVGCDNRTGDAWTEEFPGQRDCIEWLLCPDADGKGGERL